MSNGKPADTTAADTQAAVAAATAEGAKAAQARIKAIMTSEEAKGRETLAEHLAYESEVPVEAAIAALGKAPKAVSTPPPAEAGGTGADAEAYEKGRMLAAGQAAPVAKGAPAAATINRGEIFASRRKAKQEG